MRFLCLATTLVIVAAGLPLSAAGRGGIGDARDFNAFDLYFAGQRVRGLPLKGVDVFGAGRKAVVVANYGRCKPGPGEGCSYQVQLVNSSMCRVYPDIYVHPPNVKPVNGAQGGWVRGAKLFDVYTGRTAVSIYAASRHRAKRVAEKVEPLRRADRDELLPPPSERLLAGRGRCQHGLAGPSPNNHTG